MSVFSQYVPMTPATGTWDAIRDDVADAAFAAIARFAPDVADCVIDRQVLGPADIEERIGLTGGHIFQGEILPDQMWSGRFASRTPIPGLYLCGAATHPGGSVMAVNGRNAARCSPIGRPGGSRGRKTLGIRGIQAGLWRDMSHTAHGRGAPTAPGDPLRGTFVGGVAPVWFARGRLRSVSPTRSRRAPVSGSASGSDQGAMPCDGCSNASRPCWSPRSWLEGSSSASALPAGAQLDDERRDRLHAKRPIAAATQNPPFMDPDVAAQIEADTAWYAGVQAAMDEAWYAGVAGGRGRQPGLVTRELRERSSGSCNGDVACFLECTKAHESDTSGGYGAVSGSGTYRGAYQFSAGTWAAAAAGAGYEEYAGVPVDQVPAEVQDAAAAHLYSVSGTQPWGGRC